MNKFKKIATAVIATVMAGTMVASLAACDPTNPDNGGNGGFKPSAGEDKYHVLNEDGSINYDAYKRDTPVTLNIGIGHEKTALSTSFKNLGATIKLPDGKSYEDGNMKPAWTQMGKDLNITWKDVWTEKKTSDNLKEVITTGKYETTDMLTTDLSKAVDYAVAGTDVLNLGEYLDYMPNFKMFLEKNPVVYLSLLQEGMQSDGSNKIIYVAPYFDGNDDIERYCIIRQDWAAKLLNGTTALTEAGTAFSASCAATTSVVSYMGTTGKITVESSNDVGTGKVNIVKNYDAALAAAKDDSKPLGAAYKAIANEAYSGTSGNIVDIQNAALKKNAAATGSQLVELVRAYIDVCYQTEAGAQFYSSTERANLFNGYDACWDVDDLVALLRCVKTNGKTLTGSETTPIQGIVPRSGQNDRTPDMHRLAGQLYGARGVESRYEYLYIDKDGNLQDGRNDKEFYQAFENMNKLTQEGLVADYSGISAFNYAQGFDQKNDKAGRAFMMYDYSQTQTLNGFYAEDGSLTGVEVPRDYNFAPIVTPVSKWDVDGDGNHTDIMRFTESWRSTKVSGVMLNGGLTKDENKLKAALQFIDYLYSEDGQIVSTYGPMATNADGDGGFWYNAQATAEQATAGKYFTYKGVKYSGTDYKGRTTPTVTPALYDSFKGKEVKGYSIMSNDTAKSGRLSFTNYARYLIGSTLPVGVKDQSFENQLTSLMGQTGANKVGVNLALGTIKGLTLELDANNWWYTCVPTGLPVDSNYVKNVLNNADMNTLKYFSGEAKSGGKDFYNVFNYVILYGTTGKFSQQDQDYDLTSVDALLKYMSDDLGGQKRENTMATGWNNAKQYWNWISKVD